MADTIESFVAKLRVEGIDAGKQEAERIAAEARAEADRVVAAAKARADQLVAAAKVEADAATARGRTELELAVRDAALRLRDGASRAIAAMLARAAERTLADPAWLQATLKDLVRLWAEAEREGKPLAVKVSAETRAQLAAWALAEAKGLELQAGLGQAGFAYALRGAQVEVTAESVAQTLKELVSPELQRLVDQALRPTP